MAVAVSTKTVKRINAQQSDGRTVERVADRTGDRAVDRTVVMERTASANRNYGGNQRTVRGGEYRTGRSVTVGKATAADSAAKSNGSNNGASDDYEEIF